MGFTAGTYGLLRRYFDVTTDLALQHRMAHELMSLGAPVPEELQEADQAWYGYRESLFPGVSRSDSSRNHDDDDDDDRSSQFDSDVSAIFVLPLNGEGRIVYDPNPSAAPASPDRDAFTVAMQAGRDTRTAITRNGESVRLLTYRVDRAGGPAAIQLGRLLTDQERLLSQVLVTLTAMGGIITLGIGLGSWYVAGRALRGDAAAWDRQQSFVANASHELRSPLALIRASAEFAKRGSVMEEDRNKLLDDIIVETDYMTRLTDDLLLLSRLDAGSLQLSLERIEVAGLFANLVPQVQRLAESRGINIDTGAAAGEVRADETRLRQVLLILIDNAIRYSPPGGRVSLTSEPGDRSVIVSIADRGAGIPPEALPHVFERFYQVDAARGHGSGAGIGLSLAKALIEAQGGTIQIRSELGAGTIVAITLPAAG